VVHSPARLQTAASGPEGDFSSDFLLDLEKWQESFFLPPFG